MTTQAFYNSSDDAFYYDDEAYYQALWRQMQLEEIYQQIQDHNVSLLLGGNEVTVSNFR